MALIDISHPLSWFIQHRHLYLQCPDLTGRQTRGYWSG